MKRFLLQFIIVVIGALAPFNLLSQTYDFNHLSTVDGLSHNEVRRIVKDSYGYLWLGTQNGLSRFDGLNFVNYKASKTNVTYQIQGDKIYSLAASSNKIWVGTTKGLSIINSKTAKVLDDELPEASFSKIKNSFINCIYSDAKDAIWLSSRAGNFIINASNYALTEVLEGYKIHAFKEISNTTIWVGTSNGALLYNSELQQIIESYPNLGRVEHFFTDKFGVFWAASSRGVFRFLPEKNSFLKMFSKHGTNAIAEAKNGAMLFSSYGNGLLVYSRTTEKFKTLKSDPKNQKALSSNDLYAVFVDKEGLVWVGTQEGLDVYDWTRSRFKSLVHDPDDLNSLNNNFVQAIYKDKEDTYWIGTRDRGIDRMRFKENSTKSPDFEHVYSNTKDDNALWGTSISSIFQDAENRIWVASIGEGLNLYNTENKTFTHYVYNEHDKTSIASDRLASILQDHKKRIWIGTMGGLSLMQEDEAGTISFKNFKHDKYNPKSLGLNAIFKVFQDSKNRIWLAMNQGGISLLHEEEDGEIWFENFKSNAIDKETLSSNEAFVVFEDSKKRVWFGTSSGGFNLLIETTQAASGETQYRFKHYTENDGLSDNEVNSILEDGSGKLWIATNKGFSHFNPETETFVNYTTYDGVLKGKFRKNSAYKNEDGTLFFGGVSGINYFNPDTFKSNLIKPKPQFTALFIDNNRIEVGEKIDDKIVLNNVLSSGSTISLSEQHNRFQIDFTALSFASPLRNRYKYKLEGYDADWKETSVNKLKANYFNLPGGSYTFLLKAANNDGLWNESPIYLHIEVASSFVGKLGKHKKWVFSIAAIFTLLLVFLIRKKTTQNKTKKEEKAKVKTIKKEDATTIVSDEDKQVAKKLKTIVATESLYLNPLLSLPVLADKLNISSNQLSTILNDCMNTNFYDFVNSYRVEEVKQRLASPKYKNQTLLAISGDCGFNSKSAFNRIFKNVTGKTPSQYQKSLKSY